VVFLVQPLSIQGLTSCHDRSSHSGNRGAARRSASLPQRLKQTGDRPGEMYFKFILDHFVASVLKSEMLRCFDSLYDEAVFVSFSSSLASGRLLRWCNFPSALAPP